LTQRISKRLLNSLTNGREGSTKIKRREKRMKTKFEVGELFEAEDELKVAAVKSYQSHCNRSGHQYQIPSSHIWQDDNFVYLTNIYGLLSMYDIEQEKIVPPDSSLFRAASEQF
jgi:hypothetical protein